MAIHMGEVIRRMAKEKGLKAEDIAPVIKKTVGTVYGIFRNKSIDTDTLFVLSAFFDKPIAEFFGDAYTQVAVVEESTGNRVIDESTVREMQHEIELLKLQLSHKDELIAVYRQNHTLIHS